MTRRIIFSAFNWQPARNIGLTLGSMLRRVVWLRDGGPTTNWVTTALYFGRYVERLHSRQGWRGVVIHLKACHVLLNQAVARYRIHDKLALGVRIKTSRQGIPLVIPVKHRQAIMSFDKWTIKIWSSFFWLYRVISIPGKLSLKTITTPYEVNYLVVLEFARWLNRFLPILVRRICPKAPAIWDSSLRSSKVALLEREDTLRSMLQRTEKVSFVRFVTYVTATALPRFISRRLIIDTSSVWAKFGPKAPNFFIGVIKDLVPIAVPLLTSGPNSQKGMDEDPGPTTRTSVGCLLTDILVWRMSDLIDHVNKMCVSQVKFIGAVMSQGIQAISELDGWKQLSDAQVSMYTRTALRKDGTGTDNPMPGFSQGWGTGKLAFIPEPAGKVRVVAMVDYLSQMILKPLHEAMFEFLRNIPQDGTFDQHRPVELLTRRLGPKAHYFCYDLSAATDRFPATICQIVLGFLVDPEFGEAWRNFLNLRDFRVPRRISNEQRVPRNTPLQVRYHAGQPMGAYGHWSVFSLSHHLTVQFAAYQAFGKLEWFADYALLGDDIVIANAIVAEYYRSLLHVFGVKIGIAKSIISKDGVLEFAKRTWRVTSEHTLVDLSGISLKEIGAAYANPDVLEGLLQHTNVLGGNYTDIVIRVTRFLGLGRRVQERIQAPFEKQRSYIRNLMLMLMRPGAVLGMESFEQWITRIGVSSQATLSDKRKVEIWDAFHQILLARLEVAFGKRVAFLDRNQVPLLFHEDEQGVHVNDIHRWESAPPNFLRWPVPANAQTFEYQQFLNHWIWKPFLKSIYGEIHEQVEDLVKARNASPLDGYSSLDEMYQSLTRTLDEISRMNTTINLFIRDPGLKPREVKRRARVRSSIVRLWHRLRLVVREQLVR